MSKITNYRPDTIRGLEDDLHKYKHDPSQVQRAILNRVVSHNITNPTNPFIFLLESTIASHSAAATDHFFTLRKEYASMAIDRQDLYLHMADADYQDRWAAPSTAEFSVIIEYDSLMFVMQDHLQDFRYKSAIIARDTEVMIGDLVFTMENAVEIREYKNGVITASHMDDRLTHFNRIRRTEIKVTKLRLQNNRDMITFEIDIRQLIKKPHYYTREISMEFTKEIPFDAQFLRLDAYHRKPGSTDWLPVRTTHTQETYTTDLPIFVVSVRESSVIVSLPDIFSAIPDMISNELRIDVLSTSGDVHADLGDYAFESFSHHIRAIDEPLDWGPRQEAFAKCSCVFVSKGTVTGGRSEISFEELRDRVVYNNVEESKIPITKVDTKFLGLDIGFDVDVVVDDLTKRIFRATKSMPSARHEKLLTPGSSLVASYIFNLNQSHTKKGLLTFPGRMTIRENTIFSHLNGLTELVSERSWRAIHSETPETVRDEYLAAGLTYTPFLYAIDVTMREMAVGVYNMSTPGLLRISHVKKNSSLGRDINTKTSKVYFGVNRINLTLSIPPVANIPSVPLGELLLQVSFLSADDGQRYWVRSYADHDDSATFTVSIKTFWEIDPIMGAVRVFDVWDSFGDSRSTWLSLSDNIVITYGSDSRPEVFKDEGLIIYNDKIERLGGCGISSESAKLSIGEDVEWLWKNYRSSDYSPREATYRNYKVLVYPEDVYWLDPKTGSSIILDTDNCVATRRLLHHRGDPILDADGELQYEYRVGDLIPRYPGDYSSKHLFRSVDLLLFDAAYLLGQDPIYDIYRDVQANEVAGWSDNQLTQANEVVLEQSWMYFHPKNTMGHGYTALGVMELQVGIAVELNVPDTVAESTSLKRTISKAIIIELDRVFTSGAVSMSSIYLSLREVYESSIYSMDVKLKGGELLSTTLVDGISAMALKKVLRVRENGTLEIAEDVDIFFNKKRFLEIEDR